jgi:hypothetical protein
MFYDEHGNHVRTKKEILDENGAVRKGCRIVKKGDVYERTLFTAKNKLFKQEGFVDEAKRFYTDLINLLIEDDKEKLHVFDKNGLYLATKKIGKNNPKAEQIKTDNEIRMKWNREVDWALVSNVPEKEIRQIKQEYITDKVKMSVKIFGNKPEKLASIINTAVAVLSLLIYKVIEKARELKEKLFESEPIHNPAPTVLPVDQKRVNEVTQETKSEQVTTEIRKPEQTTKDIQPIEPVDQRIHEQAPEPAMQIPQRPVMPEDAKAYPKLVKIKQELDKQNAVIFQAERERNTLEIERDDLRGLQKLTRKAALQKQIDSKNEQIDILKTGLSGIARRYGYENVQHFYGAYNAAGRAYLDYQDRVKEWESLYGENANPKQKSLHERMQEYQQKADEQNRGRRIYSKDRGAR